MKLVQTALSSTKIPVYLGAFRATTSVPKPPKSYCTYTTMTKEVFHTDDVFAAYETFVYLNMWTTTDPTANIAKVRNAMRTNGFSMVEEREEYDEETGLNLVIWTWSIQQEADA